MHIILTHEQADFDALASLLGAFLIHETAVPVLPRRLNRNVRAFLTLYGMDLPFEDVRDLPTEPIDIVTLVDTQSMVSIKGMGDNPQVRVIDHHPLRTSIPEDWIVTTVELGATTTLLVEEIRERTGVLSTIQATLLLLGIYEDTGSLTYTRTTARDLLAAAYLLDEGASLQIASDFLNHPLSKTQQDLYDRLRSDAQHIRVYGHTISVTCGDAGEMDEEISSVAHKLRDLLDPDALFMLVTTRSGIQLIARSTNDHIDVAKIAAEFGGGGHERAAASLIRDRTMQSVCDELKQILPQFVDPSIVVSQIMSHSPQLLTPDTPVDEASTRMRRYGYEGYPVVKDNKVIGLLTRRAVDRTLAHQLNLTAASIMEAGEHTVYPEDSIEHLQRVMTDTGWGQIPVVDPHSEEIIGIVTRTDLLKTLTQQPRLPGKINLTSRLESALSPARLSLIKTIAETAHEQSAALYLVGGFVRDLMMDQPSQDFDLVVEGDAIGLAKTLAEKLGGRITSHTRFGTAKWFLCEDSAESCLEYVGYDSPDPDLKFLDFVTARTEFYTYPTALPKVERGSIKLDLHRRDFTINTLALRLDGPHFGELHDYWGGLSDLRSGLVRVLHSLSFVDDPTRILRAVRFEQRFKFIIDQRTMELLLEAVPMLDRLSGDRIRHEFDHIFLENLAGNIMSRLAELNLLTAVDPALTWDDWLSHRINSLQSFQSQTEWGFDPNIDNARFRKELAYILWLIRLDNEDLYRVIDRLRITSSLKDNLVAASDLWFQQASIDSSSTSAIVERLDAVPPFALLGFYIATPDSQLHEFIDLYLNQWKSIYPTVDGHDLRMMGLPPGPIYRKILRRLREAWLDGEITSEFEEETMLKHMLRDKGLINH